MKREPNVGQLTTPTPTSRAIRESFKQIVEVDYSELERRIIDKYATKKTG